MHMVIICLSCSEAIIFPAFTDGWRWNRHGQSCLQLPGRFYRERRARGKIEKLASQLNSPACYQAVCQIQGFGRARSRVTCQSNYTQVLVLLWMDNKWAIRWKWDAISFDTAGVACWTARWRFAHWQAMEEEEAEATEDVPVCDVCREALLQIEQVCIFMNLKIFQERIVIFFSWRGRSALPSIANCFQDTWPSRSSGVQSFSVNFRHPVLRDRLALWHTSTQPL